MGIAGDAASAVGQVCLDAQKVRTLSNVPRGNDPPAQKPQLRSQAALRVRSIQPDAKTEEEKASVVVLAVPWRLPHSFPKYAENYSTARGKNNTSTYEKADRWEATHGIVLPNRELLHGKPRAGKKKDPSRLLGNSPHLRNIALRQKKRE